jgi:cation diffusion facilitator family transporter
MNARDEAPEHYEGSILPKAPETSLAHIFQSLAVNAFIATVKLGAALFTRSGAMLAEALHSFADCSNQILLLIGVRQAKRPPDPSHPLGYGRRLYFWSFIVALMLFAGGGVFSIYEGIDKIRHPSPITHLWLDVGILCISIVLETGTTLSNVKELRARGGGRPFFKVLRETKDSDLVVVFGENSADVVGLSIALIALVTAKVTGNTLWDGIGSLLIGVVLIGVAIFLGREVESLLVGEAADPAIEQAARAIAEEHPGIEQVLNVIAVQQGPGEVLLAIKVSFPSKMTSDEVCRTINDFEEKLRAVRPEVRWLFVEPDIPRDGRHR